MPQSRHESASPTDSPDTPAATSTEPTSRPTSTTTTAHENAHPLDAHIAMFTDPRFIDLKKRLLRFIVPVSFAFMAWYLLYVLLSAYARDFMSTVLFGSVNIALALGIAQFVTTFGIAVAYSTYTRRHVDPEASALCDELNEETSR
ncbi:DUF485 domain-containing protein [Natronoglycomyces albus]|uniref:DUF485 domain-containing protein n=1 Tax=Natronoglycomyces albus TaxID=2811108 RepID=A0A895XK64_9ACTN|nr:DUF485 domain-containing protein [Natronoglycomyces albus]QSB06141.1 DUF485 domain-containing protein [Natronoglycomyces albus]